MVPVFPSGLSQCIKVSQHLIRFILKWISHMILMELYGIRAHKFPTITDSKAINI